MFCDKVTPELSDALQEFEERFGDIVPLEMIGGTTEELLKNIQKCFNSGKDLLPEIYGLKLDGSIWY